MNIYLITGENTTLANDYLNQTINTLGEIEIKRLNEKISLSEFQTALQTTDMFSQHSVYILKNPNWIAKINKSNKAQFEECFTIAKNFNIPIIIQVKKIDKRSTSYQVLKSFKTKEKDFPEFKDWETSKVVSWVKDYCKNQSISITDTAINHFIQSYGVNISLIKQDIEKCIITIYPETTITETNISFSNGNTSGAYINLSESLKSGNINNITTSINQLTNLKEDPQKILNQILFQLNQLLPIIIGLNDKLTPDKIAKQLGKHPFFIKKLVDSLKRNKIKNKIPFLLTQLAKIDQGIKMGTISSKQGLLKLMTNIKYQN